ncbi:MAG: efflux RND transporter periplasmic adaptor subunit [Sphaerochaetaceae bacterium]|nr:efflux RND transporter periplasmic adaptor subunit [Sphaerochaetaceae bacterium]
MIMHLENKIMKAVLLISITLFTLTSCGKVTDFISGSSSEEAVVEQTVQEVEKPISVNAARVMKGPISSTIEVAGIVTTSNPVAVIGEATGTLKNFTLKVGDEVDIDQVIGRIDPSRPGMNYKMKDVTAPVSGTIVSVNTKEGSLVSPSGPLAYIQDLNDTKIKANIIEKYISFVQEGQKVEIRFDAFDDLVFDGWISSLDPTVNVQTRSLGVEIDFEDPDNRVLAGMYSDNTVIIKTIEDALLVPSTALFAKDNSFYVYVIENDRLKKTPVSKGLETYEYVQITEGLDENDVIVNTRSSLLGEGSFVSVQNEGAF